MKSSPSDALKGMTFNGIKSPGRRGLRAQLESTHRRLRPLPAGGFERDPNWRDKGWADPLVRDLVEYSLIGGQLMRVDRKARGATATIDPIADA